MSEALLAPSEADRQRPAPPVRGQPAHSSNSSGSVWGRARPGRWLSLQYYDIRDAIETLSLVSWYAMHRTALSLQ